AVISPTWLAGAAPRPASPDARGKPPRCRWRWPDSGPGQRLPGADTGPAAPGSQTAGGRRAWLPRSPHRLAPGVGQTDSQTGSRPGASSRRVSLDDHGGAGETAAQELLQERLQSGLALFANLGQAGRAGLAGTGLVVLTKHRVLQHPAGVGIESLEAG